MESDHPLRHAGHLAVSACAGKRIVWLPALPEEGWASMDRYWRELERLAVSHPVQDADVMSLLDLEPPAVSRRTGKWWRALRKYVLYPLRVRALRADLVHVLDHSYAHLLRHLRPGIRSVVTTFDLVPLRDSHGMTPTQVRRFERTAHCVALADVTVAVSEQTREDLIRLAGVSPERIRLVHPGTDASAFGNPVPESPLLAGIPAGSKLVLSVGSTIHRKNLGFLLQAFAHLKDRFRDGRYCFVRAGQRFDESTAARFRELLGPRGFVELGPCFGSDLVEVLQRAHVFMMPSTLEGFSFTMMEAMAAGAPVVANRMSTNPEVGLDAVLYHENGDHAVAAHQVVKLCEDEALWREYRDRGLNRVRALTWENHWQGIRESYDLALWNHSERDPHANRQTLWPATRPPGAHVA